MRYAIHLLTGGTGSIESLLQGELGLVENLTVVMLLVALGYTIDTLLRFRGDLHWLPKAFLAVYSLGAIYFAGEEASWGQHWIGWETGALFQEINDQGETNLHNTSVWLDRVPKGVLSLAVFLGGIVIPAIYLFRKRPVNPDARWWWLMPTHVVLPSAILATIATWPAKIERETGVNFYFAGSQEMKEFYFAFFILLFILSLNQRLRFLHRNGQGFASW